jgi:hypothetical protein
MLYCVTFKKNLVQKKDEEKTSSLKEIGWQFA